MGQPAVTRQEHYQFQDDGADANTSTLLGTEDTSNTSLELDTTYFLRIKLYNSSGGTDESNQAYQLEYDINNSGSWASVTTSSSNVRAVDGSDTDGDTMGTERLTTAGTYDSTNSQYSEDGLTGSFVLAQGTSAEVVFAIQFRSADLTAGSESVTFRLTGSVEGTLDQYNATPTAVMPSSGDVTATPGAGEVEILGYQPGVTHLIDVGAGLVEVLGYPYIGVNHYWAVYTEGNGGSATNDNVKNGTGTGYVTGGSGFTAIGGIIEEQLTGLSDTTTYDLEWYSELTDGSDSVRADTVTFSTNAQADPGVGLVEVLGYAPTLTIENTIAVGAGEVEVLGYAPTLQLTIPVGAGEVEALGYQVATELTLEVPVGAGLVEVLTYPVTTQVRVNPGSGEVEVLGYSVNLAIEAEITIPTGVGEVEILGYNPEVTAQIDIGSGLVEVIGYNPEVSAQVSVGAGEVEVIGYAPSVTAQINVGAGLVEVIGYNPQVTNDRSVGTGEVLIEGYQPTVTAGAVVIELTIPVGAGLIRIHGEKPTVALVKDPNYGGWPLYNFFFTPNKPASRGSGGSQYSDERRREEEDELLMEMIQQFLDKVA